ncbi:MAG: KEOPS complex subunit Pcc1 [Candidatus Aenigmatarchaeota archaeon]
MRAELELDIKSPELVKKAIEVEDDESSSLDVSMEVNDSCLGVCVDVGNISNLRAGVNTILRLVKTAQKSMIGGEN